MCWFPLEQDKTQPHQQSRTPVEHWPYHTPSPSEKFQFHCVIQICHLIIGCNQVKAVNSGPMDTLGQSCLSTSKVGHNGFLRELLHFGYDQVQWVQWPLVSLDSIPDVITLLNDNLHTALYYLPSMVAFKQSWVTFEQGGTG